MKTLSWLGIFMLLLTACPKGKKAMHENLAFKMDRALGKNVVQNLHYDIERLSSYQINTQKGSWFDQIFAVGIKKHEGLYVAAYLSDRINYILPMDIDLKSTVPDIEIAYSRNNFGMAFQQNRSDTETRSALNLGLALFYLGLQHSDLDLVLRYSRAVIYANDPRAGIILVDKAYFGQTYVNPNIGSIHRLTRLIHEARHSDCTGGLDAEDLQRLKNGELPKNISCGHLHTEPCIVEGIMMLACESQPWGANAVEAVFSSAIAESCENCDEIERQVALANAAVSWGRVTIRDELLAGQFGNPDMSSQVFDQKYQGAANISTLRQERAAINPDSSTPFEILPAEEL